MTSIGTIFFIIAYGLGLFYWKKKITWRLNSKISRSIKCLHYVCFLICFTVGITYFNFDIGLRGLWTTRTIIIFTLITGVFFIFIVDKASIRKIEKLYFKIFSFLPILTAGILFIPFLGVVIVLSLFGQLSDPATRVYYEDDKLRIQSSFVGILGPPRLDIFEKKLIFEKRLERADFWANEIDSISVSYDPDSTRVIGFGLFDYEEERKGETKLISLRPLK